MDIKQFKSNFFDFIEYSSINRHSNTILILYLKKKEQSKELY